MEARWSRIEMLFAEALARDAPERHAFLQAACADDPALCREVEAMLTAHERPLGIEPRLLTRPPAGTRIGPYRLLKPLGVGGMGSVWLAERADGLLDRRAAVKLVRLAYTPEEADALRRRFEAERRILARLEHPGIVRLLEAGTAAPSPGVPGGTPYFAMDVVEGAPITTYARQQGLRVAERVRLFLQVCEAVHYAHQRLVVHRDLKPSNILVTEDGTVKLLDFGIARLLEDDESTLTEAGARPMTRAYAAPEQLRGEPPTTATDVYSLGVVLYELLAGRRPFEAPTPTQLEQAILEATPSRPSAALAAAEAPGPVEPHHLRGDLDTIVLKALRKEPAERYASAEALAADLRHHLAGLPVSARAPTLGYRTRAFVRRHRAGVAAAAAALALLVAFTVALAIQQRATARERDTAQATADFLESLFGAADPLAGERQDTLRIAALLDRGIERARIELADQPLVRARLLHVIGRSYVRLGAQPSAEAPLTEAVSILRTEDDPATLAQSLAELATVRSAQWQHGEAEALAREALALADRVEDPAFRSHAEHTLARTLLNAGRPRETESLLQSSIARQRTQPGSDDADVMAAEQTLARALFDQGRLDEAEALLLALRERHTRLHGADDPRLISVLSTLTFLYLVSGRLDEAEGFGAEAVARSRDARPGSSTLGEVLAAYGAVLRRQGRLGEAETVLREALALPPMRPESHAIPLGTLASVLQDRGDLGAAVATQRRAIALLRKPERPDPSALAYSRTKLARLLREQGRFAEAEAELLAAQAEATGVAGSHHHGGDPVTAELAALYEAWNRPNDAAAWRARLDE